MRAKFVTVMEGNKKQIVVTLYDRKDLHAKGEEAELLTVTTGLIDAAECTETYAALQVIAAMETYLHRACVLFREQGLLPGESGS